ncbi:MAG: SRPBCC domain-containing protein [Actinomycetes bacterium]
MTTFAPVVREITVSATPLRAFWVWTDQLQQWWPFATHSVYGASSTAAFRGGVLVETGADGSTCSWGTVTTWEPGRRLTMTWHPGSEPDQETVVDVTFLETLDGGTRVTLTHTGWEKRTDAARARADYESGWPGILDRYDRSFETADA